MKKEIQFTQGSIGFKEHILIMTLVPRAPFSVYGHWLYMGNSISDLQSKFWFTWKFFSSF